MTFARQSAVVIGTGPSGCAVVAALLERGVRPIVLESSFDGAHSKPESGSDSEHYVGFKTWKGSDAMYRSHPYSRIRYDADLNTRAANYFGGFSRVWGATFDKYREFWRWPAGCIPMREDWEAVEALVPRSVTGVFAHESRTLALEPRLQSLLRPEALHSRYETRPSCLAVDTRISSPNACQLSTSCLQGCPHESIWWSGSLFEEWERTGVVRILRGRLVHSVIEENDRVTVRVQDGVGQLKMVHADQVFLAGGALGTAAVLVSSNVVPSLTVRDSQTVFGGMLALRGARKSTIRTHSLSHMWLRDRVAENFLVQVYPPDRSHVKRLSARFPLAPNQALRQLNNRLFPLIAYLDSDHSGSLRVSRVGDFIRVATIKTGDNSFLRQCIARLAAEVLKSGFVIPPHLSFFDLATPGSGYHMGASLPHGPATDPWGRPHGLSRIHVVDSSVLPHIEVGSITPTVMANAHRIARTTPLMATP